MYSVAAGNAPASWLPTTPDQWRLVQRYQQTHFNVLLDGTVQFAVRPLLASTTVK